MDLRQHGLPVFVLLLVSCLVACGDDGGGWDYDAGGEVCCNPEPNPEPNPPSTPVVASGLIAFPAEIRNALSSERDGFAVIQFGLLDETTKQYLAENTTSGYISITPLGLEDLRVATSTVTEVYLDEAGLVINLDEPLLINPLNSSAALVEVSLVGEDSLGWRGPLASGEQVVDDIGAAVSDHGGTSWAVVEMDFQLVEASAITGE